MLKNLLIVILLSFAGAAQAETDIETYSFNENRHIQGMELIQIRTLLIDRLQEQNKRLNNYQLVGVTLYTKSFAGRAEAHLRTGDQFSTKIIPASPYIQDFQSDRPYTFNVIEWDLRQNPVDPDQLWQIHFNGNIKIDSMQFHLRPISQTRTIRIPFRGHIFEGRSRLHIREELQRMGYDTRGAQLKRVTLLAKSFAGYSDAQLRVGDRMKQLQPVRPTQFGYIFENDVPGSYNSIRWTNYGATPGVWQIDMHGLIKVHAIVVEINE